MARVSTYLNFQGRTEEAFRFYAKVFGTEDDLTIMRFRDMPEGPDLDEAERNLVMHAELPILAGHMLMATDMVESMGQVTRTGNNTTINLEPDTREEVDRLYSALAQDSVEKADPQEVPWGYWGTCLDRFGIRWMFNVALS